MAWMAIVAAVMAGGSALAKGMNESAAYKSQANVDRYNAKVAADQAVLARQVANQREETQRRDSRVKLGRLRASQAQNVIGEGGSALDIEQQSEMFAELDALNIRYEGTLESKNQMDRSRLFEYNASENDASAKSAKRMSYFNAASSALSTYVSAGGKFPGGAATPSSTYYGVSSGSGGLGFNASGGSFYSPSSLRVSY